MDIKRRKTVLIFLSIIIFLLILLKLGITWKFFEWAFARFTLSVKLSIISVIVLSLLNIFFIRNRLKIAFLTSSIIIQIFIALVFVELSKLTTFQLIFYRTMELLPQGQMTKYFQFLLFNIVIQLPFLMALIFKDENLRYYRKLVISGILLGNISGFFLNESWLSKGYDLNVNYQKVKSNFKENLSREELAISILNWTHNNIKTESSIAPLTLNKLIKNGKGTCGLQSKVCGGILKSYGFPVRYILIHSQKWKNFHYILEVYLNNSWALFDPQKNIYFKKEEKFYNIYEISKNKQILEELNYTEDLWENIIIFEDGNYVKITKKNKDLYY